MDFFVIYASYILLAICIFGLLGLFVRIFTILFKK